MARKKTTRKSSEPDLTEISFEESLASLQGTVSALESGNLSLTESLSQYESGVKYLRICLELLDKTEQRIRQLIRIDENGEAVLADFGHAASADSGIPSRGTAASRPQPHEKTIWEEDEDDEDDDSLFSDN